MIPVPAPLTAMALATLVAYTPASALAQAAGNLPGLSAEALFAEGRRLMAEGRTEQACAKFRESERLDPAVGTLLNLARCEKTLGHTASAWLDYREAASRAHAAGESQRERVARGEADALSPLLPHLHVSVPANAQLEGLELTLDAAACPSSLWNSSLPLDPGTHTLAARAPGFEPWTTTVALAPSEEREAVVPRLERSAEPPPSSEAARSTNPAVSTPAVSTPPVSMSVEPAQATSRASRPPAPAGYPGRDPVKLTGFVASGVGAALLVTGGGVALHAKRLDARSREDGHCDGTTGCDERGLALNRRALHSAELATGFAVAGAVLLAAGVVLVVLPRHSDASKAASSSVPSLQAELGGVSGLRGSW
jgi:hypothetical protein